MGRPELLITRVRIAVGVMSLALFAHTAFWLLYDLVGQGVLSVWSAWSTGPSSGLIAATSLDIALAALQLAAGCGVLLHMRGAGGLLVAACSATLVFRAPVLWYVLLDSPSDPWFGDLAGPSLTAVGSTCLLVIIVALAQAGLLFQARRLEQSMDDRERENVSSGVRPAKVTAAVSSVLLIVLNIFYICRNTLTAFQLGPESLGDLLVGKGSGHAVLGVSSAYQWACLTVLCGVGLALSGRRRPSATGFALGLAVFMMPIAFMKLSSSLSAGTLFHSPVDTVQSVVELVGSAAVVSLTLRDMLGDGWTLPGLNRSSATTSAEEVRVPS